MSAVFVFCESSFFFNTLVHFSFSITPMGGQLKKKQAQSVSVSLVMRTSMKLGQVLAIDVEGITRV